MNHTRRVETAARPWGLWATAGFTLVTCGCCVLVQEVSAALFVMIEVVRHPEWDVLETAGSRGNSGLVLAVASIATAIVCGGLVVLFTWLRKGISVREYLCIRPVSLAALCRWIGAMLLLIVVWDAITVALNRPMVPDFVKSAYASAGFVPLFLLGIVVAAPLFEELCFRGFLFEGIRFSRLGSIGAVLITSSFWTAMHLQYGWLEIVYISLTGVLLGVARLKSESLITTIAMHSLTNLIATLEAAIL